MPYHLAGIHFLFFELLPTLSRFLPYLPILYFACHSRSIFRSFPDNLSPYIQWHMSPLHTVLPSRHNSSIIFFCQSSIRSGSIKSTFSLKLQNINTFLHTIIFFPGAPLFAYRQWHFKQL